MLAGSIPLPLTFIHITDSHLGPTPDSLVHYYNPAAALTATVEDIARRASDASFLIHTGDLARNSRTPEGYECARVVYGLQGRAGAPGPLTMTAAGLRLDWYYVPGNSDHRAQCLSRLFCPREGIDYRFNHTWQQDGVRFLTLDWGACGSDEYTLEPDVFDWLARQLRVREPTVIFTHHPPVHVGVEFIDRDTPADLPRLQDLISESSVIAVFHGHTHHAWENRIGDIPVFGTGSITFRENLSRPELREIAPPQYRLVTVQDDGAVDAPVHHVPGC